MASPIQDTDHYLLGKLYREVLPLIIGGRMTTRRWFVWLAGVYEYGGQLATALTGLGIGAPLVAVLKGDVAGGKNAYAVLQQVLPQAWLGVGAGALIAWAIVLAVVKHQNVVTRALFARDCARAMRRLDVGLANALGTANPVAKINEIQATALQKVDEAIERDVWPWSSVWPNDSRVDLELRRQIADIRSRFMSGWDPPPPGKA